MTSEGLGDMFEGDFARKKIPLGLMGGGTDPLSVRRLRLRTPIGASGILIRKESVSFSFFEFLFSFMGSGGFRSHCLGHLTGDPHDN